MPLAAAKAWLASQPAAPETTPVATALLPMASKMPRLAALCALAVPTLTATAITTISICPITPHPPLRLGGITWLGLMSPKASLGS